LLRGRFDLHGVGLFEGPTAFVLTLSQLEGADDVRSSTFRSTGSPFTALEVRLPEAELVGSWKINEPILLDASTWGAVEDLTRSAAEDDESYATGARTVIERLARDGVVSEQAHESSMKTDAWMIQRSWGALKPIIERFAPASSLDEVSEGMGLSLRQTARLLGDFLSLAAWGIGWRQITLHGRFKIAVLLLSAEGATVEDVARIIGYGSINAMARAFRSAGLEAPSFIQQRLREAKVQDSVMAESR